MVLVIQVPLKYKAPQRDFWGYGGMMDDTAPMAPTMMMAEGEAMERSVEQAVIGHGEVEGPFSEINNLEIERDTRFPVRVTVQFYKATTSGTVTDADVRDIRKQIDQVYDDAEFVGSLVTSGYTARPTEWVESPVKSEDAFWAHPWFGWHKAY
ncbi:MAG: hypothetical protein HN348_22335 [Proteobacteria bacterium]|nr:hypothetical protein [Pseudomonadota bacterium]